MTYDTSLYLYVGLKYVDDLIRYGDLKVLLLNYGCCQLNHLLNIIFDSFSSSVLPGSGFGGLPRVI